MNISKDATKLAASFCKITDTDTHNAPERWGVLAQSLIADLSVCVNTGNPAMSLKELSDFVCWIVNQSDSRVTKAARLNAFAFRYKVQRLFSGELITYLRHIGVDVEISDDVKCPACAHNPCECSV